MLGLWSKAQKNSFFKQIMGSHVYFHRFLKNAASCYSTESFSVFCNIIDIDIAIAKSLILQKS